MWICGGLTPNYHALADFRVAHGDRLDTLLTHLLASLMAAGVLRLHRIAQDGTRVRASAGAASFRRGSTLERCLIQAKDQIEALRKELADDPSASTAREKAGRERAARERQAAVERALKELPKAAKAHERSKRRRERRAKQNGVTVDTTKSEPRVSTTDAEARVMKMADGGFRPAYNLQFATDTESRLIVGVDATSEGSDSAQMVPMLKQIIGRTGHRPAEYLVDGGFTKLEAIDEVESAGTRVYAPVPTPRRPGVNAYTRKYNDTDLTAAWRARMNTDVAKSIYAHRGATAEPVHADFRRWRGLNLLPVRGRKKVRAVALLHVLTYNLLRVQALRPAA
jgi:hypothetical protein